MRKFMRVVSEGYMNLRKGLKKVHIGKDTWLIGKSSMVDGRKHQVIYGPDRKEFHLWDKDVDFVTYTEIVPPHDPNKKHSKYQSDYASRVNRHGNASIQQRVKIYILTHILDDRNNWCFDLSIKPEIGKRVKVIYENGTVQWVDQFDGEFHPAEINRKYEWDKTGEVYGTDTRKAVAYRIN